MRYKGYEVDPSFIDGDNILWKLTGNGQYILGTKSGKKYFIKCSLHLRYPDKSLPEKTYQIYQDAANKIERKQELLKKAMKRLNWEDDHIVVEEDNFWDTDTKRFVTITACVPDALSNDYDYTVLSPSGFMELAKSLTELLCTIHDCHVIHGDLKEKNIIITKRNDKYIPYLIDFDSSYMDNEIPEYDSIGGSEGYTSPEILKYSSEEGASLPSTITPATDIFTLALIFHRLWTKKFPGVDDEGYSVGLAVYFDKEITIDNKFDVKIGTKHNSTLKGLIKWMLVKDYTKRPSANEVLDVLNDRLEVPFKYEYEFDENKFNFTLWDGDSYLIELVPIETFIEKKVKSFNKINLGSGADRLKYHLTYADNTEKNVSALELCDLGLAKKKEVVIDEPWPEHQITFVSPEVLLEKGCIKIKRVQYGSNKRYLVTTTKGTTTDYSFRSLKDQGLAIGKTIEVSSDTPWPEDGTNYNQEKLQSLNIYSISRVEFGGDHYYHVVYNEMVDGKRKEINYVPGRNLVIMGLIKK